MGCMEENLKTEKKAKEHERVSRRDAEFAEGKDNKELELTASPWLRVNK